MILQRNSDSNNIFFFLWHESESINKKKKIIFKISVPILRLQVPLFHRLLHLNWVSLMIIYVQIALYISHWNDFCEISFRGNTHAFWRSATNGCKKFKLKFFWERPLYEIWEYAFNVCFSGKNMITASKLMIFVCFCFCFFNFYGKQAISHNMFLSLWPQKKKKKKRWPWHPFKTRWNIQISWKLELNFLFEVPPLAPYHSHDDIQFMLFARCNWITYLCLILWMALWNKILHSRLYFPRYMYNLNGHLCWYRNSLKIQMYSYVKFVKSVVVIFLVI